jgi:hypothetical protein
MARSEFEVWFVTGGAQGIGRAIAEAALASGAAVAIGDVDWNAARECVAEWKLPERTLAMPLDVSREGSVRRAVARAASHYGRIDVLVNNAGISDPEQAPLERLALADWNRMLATDLTGAFLCAKHAAKHLRRERGSIVNIASTRAIQSEPDTEAYAAAKGGLVALSHALAASLGPDVRVNALSPGWIEVSDWKKRAARRAPKLRRIDHAQHPAGRVGRPEDVAEAVLWLARAGFATGTHLVLDGGMTRRMRYAE